MFAFFVFLINLLVVTDRKVYKSFRLLFKMEQTRREFVRNIIGGLGAFILAPSNNRLRNIERESVANLLLDKFPNNIDGARDVVKKRVPGADKTLVHVAQFQDNPDLIFHKREYAAKVQLDIYKILNHFIDNYGIEEVYSEITPARALANLSNIDKDSIDLFSGEEFNATRFLEYQERLKINPANIYERDFVGVASVIRGDLSVEEFARQKRQTALELVSGNDRVFNILVFNGRGFGKEVNEWNSQNPRKKYSLIEVVPQSYVD